jgi:hypothetical protein
MDGNGAPPEARRRFRAAALIALWLAGCAQTVTSSRAPSPGAAESAEEELVGPPAPEPSELVGPPEPVGPPTPGASRKTTQPEESREARNAARDAALLAELGRIGVDVHP